MRMANRESREVSGPNHTATAKEEAMTIANPADEEMNVGSTTSFKTYDGAESVELHNYDDEEADPIRRKRIFVLF